MKIKCMYKTKVLLFGRFHRTAGLFCVKPLTEGSKEIKISCIKLLFSMYENGNTEIILFPEMQVTKKIFEVAANLCFLIDFLKIFSFRLCFFCFFVFLFLFLLGPGQFPGTRLLFLALNLR